ncbi:MULTISPECIES: thermosome subunit alpha [unclassified Methanoregula]|uniref:thermosome subunit alpha n=1 Tax=unclassified Methanoregula TaxID=2649730 RepID=UPI0009C44952|nr:MULTISPECIES: thermosome subunit alpha [unclassified Methanoregula]OPX64216.1 MAG: Thermosome subunit alpha [Methanoregula sp. PtaB.Bin085]OPY33660.1 MAG: Thermosome subunit alpha [Methanoregula sp. PtaU1.Bin006]
MQSQQPIIILKENVERNYGREAQRSNIMAAKAIAGAVRSTLGPRGMDKMLVGSTGDIVITNDGATILSEIGVQHPGAKMVVEVARTQDDEVGDGTTTAVVLVGALMEQAEQMLEQGIHPTVIAQGYLMGMDKALEIVDSLSLKVDPSDRKTLMKIADTAITGKSIEQVKDKLDGIIVDAVMIVAEKANGKLTVDEDDVMIKKQKGESIDDAELIRGVVIDKVKVSEQMPKKVQKAKVALISMPLEITKTQVKAKIKITTAEQVNAFGDQERETLRKLADAIVASGANVLLCQKGISDIAQFYLAKAGVLAIEDVPEKDMKYAARALNANIITKPESLTAKDLGTADLVEEDTEGNVTRISGCKNPKTTTILLRGTSDFLLEELERAVVDGTRVVMDAMEDGTYVVGGGAVETELLMKIRDYAQTVGGRVQIALEGYAAAFESIPLALAENSGFNPIDKIVELKNAHAKGKKNAGLNVYEGKVTDMLAEGVIEPLRSKRQSIQSASETSVMLIRVDDMMITQQAKKGSAAPGM